MITGLTVPVSEGQTLFDRKRKFQTCNTQCSSALQSSRNFRSSPRFVCVICRIAFATVFHLKNHSETFAHKAKVCKSKKEGANTSNPFYCEVCDILCSSSRVMEYHVSGLKHATFLQEFEDAKSQRVYGNLASNQ
ncbi:hypothetical protein QVD17_21122 [Tagetes erecta]|uniref:C2H2-type domain-containing protein n=1 Tax=Tagetes erecta TaxID=13708 RepID=A0AAD8NYP9_TARER|nr:hypothetical protein QVD17_21122 [Tagetes erecta]